MKLSIRILFFGAALAACMAASAQYQWIDKDGRRVFSDSPPPADVPDKNIIAQPHARAVAAAPAEAASEDAPVASAPSGVDQALEDKKKQAADEEAAKKKADEDKLAAQQADNCKRAMTDKAALDSGARVARPNAKGEREFLDDKARAAETMRLQDIIASDCPK